ncbi:flagellar hook-length control protein FliK, partial [bacterium]|nr:flagellar hook-length control protein FliK [bacterium]
DLVCELIKKSQNLVRVVSIVQSEQEQVTQEPLKVESTGQNTDLEVSTESSEHESKEERESFLALTKNFSKNQGNQVVDRKMSKFDQLLDKLNLPVEKIVTREVGLSLDGAKKVMLTKIVRHPGFQSSTKVVVKQIQDLTKLINPPKVNRLSLHLKPERLGEVRLEIKQINNGIKLSFEVENHAVKEIIEKNINQLKGTLKIQNIDASEVEVTVREDRDQNEANKDQQSSRNSRRKNKKSFDMNEELKDESVNSIEENYQVNQYA